MVQTNRDNFLDYIGQVRALQAAWRPLGREHLQRQLQGDGRALAIRSVRRERDQVRAEQATLAATDPHDAYRRYLEGVACSRARELAKVPDYEKTRGELPDARLPGDGGQCTVYTVISQKTGRLAEFLRLLACAAVRNQSALVSKTAHLYLLTFKSAFSAQLEQIPHLAALFYNDCLYLSAQCGAAEEATEMLEGPTSSPGPASRADAQHFALAIEMLGSTVLQGALEREVGHLREILPMSVWDRYCRGQLGAEGVAVLARHAKQAQLKLGQLRKVLSPILDPPILAGFMGELVQLLLQQWLWSGLLGLQSIGRDGTGPLGELIEAALQLPAELLGPQEAQTMAEVSSRLACLLRLSRQNLIQISNAFRREEYRGQVTLRELHTMVNMLFPDTAMKRAFLDEIAADMAV